MKRIYLAQPVFWLGLLLGARCLVQAQRAPGSVGIGTTSPDASAVLDLTASSKGLLIPRLDSVQRVAIAAPAAGLLVFQTGPQRQGFYYYSGSGGWLFLPDKARTGDNLGNGVATTALNLQGNALTGTGADLGTTIGLGVRADGGLNIGQNPSQNLFVGYQAGQANATGGYNQFSGIQAGYANTDGYDNYFSGFQSGYANLTGHNNQFIGTRTGYANTTGSYNTILGSYSGYANVLGSLNTFVGFNSGFNTTGSHNTFSGAQSGYYNTRGSDNTFTGFNSGLNNTTGSSNTFTGIGSGGLTTTASFNTFTGQTSGYYNTTGTGNVFDGYRSGYYNSTGSYNAALGYGSGPASGSGDITNATAVGANVALTQSNTVVLGSGANVGIGTSSPGQPLEVAGQVFSSAGGFQFPDHTVQATAATAASFVLNTTTPQASASFNVGGSGTIGGNAVVGGRLGLGTSAPYAQLANTAGNLIGSDQQGGNPGSLAWAATQQGYVGQFFNGQTGGAANGLAVKVLSTDAGASVLDLSAGAAQNTAGTSLLSVRANGRVGIGTNNPTEALDVRGNLRLGTDGGAATGAGQAVEFAGPGFNADAVGLYRQNTGSGTSELRLVVGSSTGTTSGDRLVLGTSAATAPGQLTTAAFTPRLTVLSSGALVYGTQSIPLDRTKEGAKPGETIPARTITPHAALLLYVGPSLPIGGSNAPVLLDPSGAVTGQQVLVTNLDTEVLPVQYAGGSVSLPQYTTARFLFANGSWTREL